MRGWGDEFSRHAANSSLTVNFVAHCVFKRSERPLRRFPPGISLTGERENFFFAVPRPPKLPTDPCLRGWEAEQRGEKLNPESLCHSRRCSKTAPGHVHILAT